MYLGDACAAELSADQTGGEQHVSPEAEKQVQTTIQCTTSDIYICMCFTSICTRLLCDQPQASQDKQPPVKTVGPLTDVDVIKLRPCEKKPVHLRPPSFLQNHIYFKYSCAAE